MTRFALFVLLLTLLLTACGGKKGSQEHVDWGQMRELFPPTLEQPPPAPGEAAAGAAPAEAAAAGAAPGAAAAAAAASDTTPDDTDEVPAPGQATAAEFQEAPPAAAATPSAAGSPAAAASPATAASPEPAPLPDEATWPRTFTANGVTFKVHEPLADGWNEDALVAHALVSAQPEGRPQPALGTMRITARTRVNETAGVVRLSEVQVTGVRFPDAPDKTLASWLAALRARAPGLIDSVSLARVQSGMAAVRARERGAAVLDVPVPRVVIAKKPTVLVYIDGEPQFVPVKGTSMSGVLNTRTVLLKGAGGKLYLRVYDGWVGADSLRGPWTMVNPPPEAVKLEQTARATGRANLLRGKPDPKTGRYPSLSKGALPQILVATKPTAVLVLDGEPRFASIPGTPLQYATNTSAHVFRDVEAKQIYVRVTGFWFRSKSTAGPWEYVPVASLPASFLAISNDSPKAAVKTAIAAQQDGGAPDDPSAPVMVAADASRARLNMTLGGDPQLEPIRGTQLNYVANASVPVIQFDDERWYAIQNGVWFTATSVTGPWTVTAEVPPEIYAIPPTTPIYGAIHSRVLSSSSDTVFYGYKNPQSLGGSAGGAIGVEDQGQDYLYTPPAGMYWGWYY